MRIELELLSQELHFLVHNYVTAATDLPPQPGGLGLHNLRRRLELLPVGDTYRESFGELIRGIDSGP